MNRSSQLLAALRSRLAGARAWLAARQIRPWRWVFTFAAIGLAIGTGMLLWTMNCGTAGCPTAEEISSFRPTEGSRILDRNGRFIGRVSYVRRVNVPLDSVPQHVRNAFLAVEDRRFYEHEGIDWRGMARAIVRNIRAMGVREGFSTITMQVARNAFIPHLMNERSMRRKLREIGTTWRIEDVLTKDEILELYLNIIYFGNGTYGVEAASRDLFGRSVSELNITQAATLAGLPKAPSSYAPRLHPDRAIARRNLVLELMVEEGYISPAQRDTARGRGLGLSARAWTLPRDTSFALDPVRELVDSVLGDSVPRGDVVVHTTLDHAAQRAAEEAVSSQAAVIQRVADRFDGRRGGEQIEGALVAVDPANGEIRALVGSRNYTRKGFNRALRARRQPGSAFKPFVYAAAMVSGWTPATTVQDLPIEITDSLGEIWSPANDRGFAGTVTLRRALMRSSNAATVRLAQEVGAPRIIATARRLGIQSPLDAVPSLPLGSFEVTPLELAAAYAPFANGGMRVRPTLVTSITAPDGTLLWEAPAPVIGRALGPQDIYLVRSMLRSVVDRGTGYTVRDLGVRGPVAGKTGTTNEAADLWFVGFTPSIVAAVWFGYDQPRSIAPNASAAGLAVPAWARFYKEGWTETGTEDAWDPPAGMEPAVIDAYTGYLANEYCPVRETAWFKPGTAPTAYCPRHPEEDDSFPARVGRFFERLLGF